MRAFPLLAVALLAACQAEPAPGDAPAQRISLKDAEKPQASAIVSPDTSAALWSVAESGQAIDFGDAGAKPLLTLACDLEQTPATFSIIRHAAALPDQSALFPFIGNGMRSRFLADTVLANGEWRWEARLPADDPQLDVFAGNRSFTATLPGRGMLEIAGSRIPGEFLEWCRSGGATDAPEPEPTDDAADGVNEAA